MKSLFNFLLFFISIQTLVAQNTEIIKIENTGNRTKHLKPLKFDPEILGNGSNYFESIEDLQRFFDFKKGQNVAEIGAFDGQNLAGFSILTDSINYYAEDINPKFLNIKKYKNAIGKTSAYKARQTNQFYMLIGNEKQSFLPENYFDKIILMSTLHEFSYMDEMLEDISTKLKSGGKLYVLENVCLSPGHKNYTYQESISLIEKHHFIFIKKDGKDIHNSSGLYRLVFKKS